MRIVSVAVAVPIRNVRTPGYRALGLRRVDAHTGGPLTPCHAIVQAAISAACGLLVRWLAQPWQARLRKRRAAAGAEVEEFPRVQPDDDEAQENARREIHQRYRVNASGACGPPLLLIVATNAAALWSPLNQTSAERIAGIVVVHD